MIFNKWYSALFMVLLVVLTSDGFAQRQIEDLDRGVVAVRRSASNVFISWRWLGTESEDVAFNVYRGDTKINDIPLTNATCFTDHTSGSETYSVAAVVDGVEQAKSEPANVWATNYKDINLQVPAGGTTPDGSYTYSPNDASVGDLDGDGKYDIVLKWNPSNAKDNSQSGYTGNVYIDGYKLDGTHMWRVDLGKNIRAGAHYTQFMVYDFDGDGKAEFACKTAPGTRDGTGTFLSKGPAASDNDAADYRKSNGYILSGEEYLTIFNGETGAEMATVNYNPPRGSVSSWGDSYGNRVDRFLACVAYLDGVHPSLVMCRGYYTRMVLAAWDWDGSNLIQRWVFDTNKSGYSSWEHQGNHQVSVADVDFDGKDEIIYGSATIDDDGSGLYNTGLGHGDALHVSDFDPTRPGLEVFAVHENSVDGMTLRAAENGKILFQIKAPFDNGRGVAGDIDPNYYGAEMWSGAGSGTYNLDGAVIGSKPSMNFLVWWDGDLSRELLDGNRITKYGEGILLNATDCSSNNGSKSTPGLSADILGDWREEVIFRTSDNKKLRIYTSTYNTDLRIRTLMHDPQYRVAIAWQNVAYNQPPHPGFYLGTDMSTPPLAPIVQADLKWDGSSDNTWDNAGAANWLSAGSFTEFNDGDEVLFSLSGNNSNAVNVSVNVAPGKVSVVSPKDYVFSGSGSLTGDMKLLKSGIGNLSIQNTNSFSGMTWITEGGLINNGVLENSPVKVSGKAVISGAGEFGNGLSVIESAGFYAGHINAAGTVTINGSLNITDESTIYLDMSDDPSGIASANDSVIVDGDLTISDNATIVINKLDGTLSEGTYNLFTYSGSFTGNISNITVEGILELLYTLKDENGTIQLEITKPRDPSHLVWDGGDDKVWNLLKSQNWRKDSELDYFAVNDTVLFDDTGNSTVNITGKVPIGNMEVNASQIYIFNGSGSISGSGGITKNGSGYLKMETHNSFTGPLILNAGYFDATTISNAGNPSGIGAAASNPSNWIINGGRFKYSGAHASTNRGITLGENGAVFELSQSAMELAGTITGTGSLTKQGGGVLYISGSNNYSGGTVVDEGSIELRDDAANESGLGSGKVVLKNATLSMYNNTGSYNSFNNNIEIPATFNATWNLDGRCDVKSSLTGGGDLNLYVPYVRSNLDGDWSAFEGNINIETDDDGGLLILNNNNGYGKAGIHLADNITAMREKSENVTINVGELTGPASSELGAGGQGSNTITWRVGTNNTNFAFQGLISDVQYKNSGAQAALIKAGSGRMTLTHSNTYSGGTVVEKGTLIVNNSSGSGTGTGNVIVNNGAVLSGSGLVDGTVTVNAGGYIMAGIGTAGNNLQVNNNVTFLPGSYFLATVNSNNGTSDKLRSTKTVDLNGTLYVNNLGSAFKKGDSFLLIQSASKTGEFSAVYPATPGEGLYWDLTGIKNAGILKVTDVPTSVDKLSAPSLISIYPNPVSEFLNVDLSGIKGTGAISVTDVSGRVICQHIQRGNSVAHIGFSSYPRGLYLINVQCADFETTKRIIKN